MRAEAMLTGSAYIFLTDDSGVGNAHAEPHFPRYVVEKLNMAMIRMILSELYGMRIEPRPEDVIRTVNADPIKATEVKEPMPPEPTPQPLPGPTPAPRPVGGVVE